MNLYRSFGNLMEAWVTEGKQCSDLELLGNIDEDSFAPSSDTRTNLCSQSLDSGVETASSDTSTSCFVSTDNTEIDVFIPERDSDELSPASTSQSPFLSSPAPSSSSSSSPCLCPSRAQEGSNGLHLKVEESPKGTDSQSPSVVKPEPLTGEEVLRQRPRSPLLPTSKLGRGQRSQSFEPRRTANSSVSFRHMSQTWKQQSLMSCDQRRLEDLCEEESTELSPGLRYLEQVCQMLEEIARQQMHIRAQEIKMDPLPEDQDTELSQTCQNDPEAVEEELSSIQRFTENADHTSTEQQHKDSYRHFRRRSASDTTVATLNHKKLSLNSRGQHRSTNDLLETEEKDHEQLESTSDLTNKPKNNWWLKFGSLRKPGTPKSQQMLSPERNSTRRRLSQFFRRRRKPLPE